MDEVCPALLKDADCCLRSTFAEQTLLRAHTIDPRKRRKRTQPEQFPDPAQTFLVGLVKAARTRFSPSPAAGPCVCVAAHLTGELRRRKKPSEKVPNEQTPGKNALPASAPLSYFLSRTVKGMMCPASHMVAANAQVFRKFVRTCLPASLCRLKGPSPSSFCHAAIEGAMRASA